MFSLLCNNSNRSWFFNKLTFARALGRCWKLRPPVSVFNTSLGTWRMLMHEKICLIPIILPNILDFSGFTKTLNMTEMYFTRLHTHPGTNSLRKHACSNMLKISPPKNESFLKKILIFFIFLLKTSIVGTRYNRLGKAVLTSTHNLCFWAQTRKIMYTPVNLCFTI